ncbi:MAG: hypothetical protein WD071_15875 [Pseudohongiella sp.]|uniref:hypothetical protein n=1 Tax=Pseudohongiella sp. TaxID=1979412 RepID=UPI0034A05686
MKTRRIRLSGLNAIYLFVGLLWLSEAQSDPGYRTFEDYSNEEISEAFLTSSVSLSSERELDDIPEGVRLRFILSDLITDPARRDLLPKKDLDLLDAILAPSNAIFVEDQFRSIHEICSDVISGADIDSVISSKVLPYIQVLEAGNNKLDEYYLHAVSELTESTRHRIYGMVEELRGTRRLVHSKLDVRYLYENHPAIAKTMLDNNCQNMRDVGEIELDDNITLKEQVERSIRNIQLKNTKSQ